MASVPTAERAAAALKASTASAARRDTRVPGYIAQFGPVWRKARIRLANARKRCEDPRNPGYPHYGGRGIKFGFPSVADAALWVLANLGAPAPGLSLDRIDNERHYEPGNLRWATSSEQNSNKRAYKRSVAGSRIRELAKMRPDLTEETIRTWIQKGFTDDEITNRRKHVGCGVRHPKLRPS